MSIRKLALAKVAKKRAQGALETGIALGPGFGIVGGAGGYMLGKRLADPLAERVSARHRAKAMGHEVKSVLAQPKLDELVSQGQGILGKKSLSKADRSALASLQPRINAAKKLVNSAKQQAILERALGAVRRKNIRHGGRAAGLALGALAGIGSAAGLGYWAHKGN